MFNLRNYKKKTNKWGSHVKFCPLVLRLTLIHCLMAVWLIIKRES